LPKIHAFLCTCAIVLLIAPAAALAAGTPFLNNSGNGLSNGSQLAIASAAGLGIAALYFTRRGTSAQNTTALFGQQTERTVLTASKPFIYKEDVVSRSVINFLDAARLKDEYGYSMADALGVAYRKNEFVNATNDLASTIDETQGERIAVADKYGWPVSSCVKFSSSFSRETGATIVSLFGNGFFAMGATAMLLYDSARNPNDAADNFYAIYEVAMGSLFRGAESMGTMIMNEDPEVSVGMIMSFAIAPEDAVLERGGKFMRLPRVAKGGERAVARDITRGAENSGIRSLADLLEERAASGAGNELMKDLAYISEPEILGAEVS